MTTKTQKTYHRNDLIRSIEDRFPHQYPEQSGAMSAAVSSILIRVEVHNPKLFQEIMDFEMGCQESMKAFNS